MTDATHAELDRICSEICDNLCRYPRECADQEALDDHCSGCQTLVDLANLAERLEQAKEKCRCEVNVVENIKTKS